MRFSFITGATSRGGQHPRLLMLPVVMALVAISLVPAAAQDGHSAGGLFGDLFAPNAPMPGTDEYELSQRSERIRAALCGMDAISEALVLIGPDGEGETAITIRVRLAEGPAPWSPQMSQAVPALVRRLEPSVPADKVFVIDSSGRVLVPEEAAPATAPGTTETAPAPALPGRSLGPLIAGAVIGLLIIAAAAWYLLAPGRRAAPGGATEVDPWAFLAQARADDLRAVFSQRRPEALGAVLAAAQSPTAARIVRKLGTQSRQPAPPARPMHPAVAAFTRTDLREALEAVEHNRRARRADVDR